VQILDYAIVAEWEVFQIWHELDARLTWLLDGAAEAKDSSLRVFAFGGLLVAILGFWSI
jgi:hypothetical protein